MSFGISMQKVPEYHFSAFRKFIPGERHITRTESDDVLIVMINGTLKFTENGKSVKLCRGDYYIQQSGLLQDGPEESECPEYFFLHFYGSEWTDTGTVLPHRGKCDPDSVLPLLNKLCDTVILDAPLLVKQGLFCNILTHLYQNRDLSERKALIDTMSQLLIKDLCDPPTLSELSEILHFSENYLIRIFKEAMGVTPHAYVNAARLRKAKLLLSSGSMTAERVAYECGFSDYAHFYRIFRKETGASPKEYRQSEYTN